jgi:L-amino acid N-acyltransferase YncA
MRGYGLGKTLMQSAIEFFQKLGTGTLKAEVKFGNAYSVKIFKELDFEEINHPQKQKEVRLFQLQLPLTADVSCN